MPKGPGQKTFTDNKCIRGIFHNGDIGERIAILFPYGGIFSGFHDKKRALWIGGYVDIDGQLSMGEFDFENTGKPCVQIIPNFFDKEQKMPCPGYETPEVPSTRQLSS